MCPSDIIEIKSGNGSGFGPSRKVFMAPKSYPCSIHVLNGGSKEPVEIQISREGNSWTDYEEGQLIIGTEISCRLRSNHEQTVMIEVFHN